MDPRVILKKKYLDINRNNVNQLQSGQEWYVLEAVRAVNQAIGRVIRHKDDYGAIFLCDRRFHQQKTQLSRWIQPHLMKQSPNDANFGMIIGELARFFRNLSTSMPEPVVRQEIKEIKKENVDSNGYLSTTTPSHQMMKQHIKIENSNEIYGSSSFSNVKSEEFTKYCKGMQQKVKNEPKGFMGSLNREVSVIDFNSTSTGESSSSSSLKTVRSFDFSQESENASKKRRLKMIPNANQLYSEPQSSVLNQLRNTKVRVKRSDFDKHVSSDKKQFMGEVSLKILTDF
jgi:regulator of telomere elongation helicase 1